MLNKITGERPQPVIEDEPVDLSNNSSAIELCEEVERFATETRIGMLSKALAVSREQCNNLISSQNVLLAEQTQQLKSLERSNERYVNELRVDGWNLLKGIKESNNQLSKSLNQTLGKISETITDIERQVSTATAKATDEAVRGMKQSINKMADNAVIAVNESAGKMINEVNKAKNEIEKAKKEIRFESGFRRFMFWISPVLAVAQTVLLIMMAL